jgi:hypothetical protein
MGKSFTIASVPAKSATLLTWSLETSLLPAMTRLIWFLLEQAHLKDSILFLNAKHIKTGDYPSSLEMGRKKYSIMEDPFTIQNVVDGPRVFDPQFARHATILSCCANFVSQKTNHTMVDPFYGCILLHEMNHMIGHGFEDWPVRVQNCLGCGRSF